MFLSLYANIIKKHRLPSPLLFKYLLRNISKPWRHIINIFYCIFVISDYLYTQQQIMKKGLKILIFTLVVTLFGVTGCFFDDDPEYDEALIYGEWYSENIGLFYRFNADYSGRYYDNNNEGKNFTWHLDGDAIEIKAQGENINVIAFETYIITDLSDSKMKCYDQVSSEKYTFTKQ